MKQPHPEHLYQAICFPIYGIPKVGRGDYIISDRYALPYLNIIEKVNCQYCAYMNGLIAYTQEIAGRSEQYWCPIKHARKMATLHERYVRFLEFGDGKGTGSGSRRSGGASATQNSAPAAIIQGLFLLFQFQR